MFLAFKIYNSYRNSRIGFVLILPHTNMACGNRIDKFIILKDTH